MLGVVSEFLQVAFESLPNAPKQKLLGSFPIGEEMVRFVFSLFFSKQQIFCYLL
jgi:hypothetical protein